MKALIDGDIILYRVGFTTETEEEWIALARTDDLIKKILDQVEADDFTVFLSDSKENNFRFQITDTYKANRKAPRPRHYEAIKGHLVSYWCARIALGMEADDALGIHQDKETSETIICSIDKDLKQVPGEHYNFVNETRTTVLPDEGRYYFYQQLLTGDVSDNVSGIRGIGPKRACKLLGRPETEEDDLFRKVSRAYLDSGLTLEQLLINGRLLKIKQEENEPLWDFPVSLSETELKDSSTPQKQVETDLGTEPITQEQS